MASAGSPGGHDETSTEQELGAAIRRIRRQHGLSQRDLRRPLGVGSHTTIVDWEAGRRLPPAEVLSAYEQHFRLPPGQLIALRERALAGRSTASHDVPAEAAQVPPALPQVRYSLPADTAAFTGRDEELEQIRAVVTSAAAAGGVLAVGAVDGMPGVGKTTLAVHVARALAAQFPDRQLFIDLHAHTPGREPLRPEEALAGLLAATGVDPRYLPADLDGQAAMWRDRMAGQRALLVLDNAATSGQVAPLIPGGRCLVLVTSRRHLGDLPGAVTPVLLDVLSPGEAEQMFTRLAPHAAADQAGVAEVVLLAGFLPLAISLLARVFARHRSWTVADLIAEVRTGLLTMAAEDVSVAAAFDVSYRNLDADSQQLFRLLGVDPGTAIDGYAAAALAGFSVRKASRLLDHLHCEGLLTEAGYRRYGMHDLLRRYAGGRATADDATRLQPALDRLLCYYQYTAALAGTHLARQVRPDRAPSARARYEIPALEDAEQALGWARANRANLLACLDLAVRAGRNAEVVSLTAGLAPLLRRDGPWVEAVTRHVTAVAAARRISDRIGEANALTDLADARQLTGDHQGAAENFGKALATYRDVGDRLGEANTLHCLGDLRLVGSDFRSTANFVEEARCIYRDIGNRVGEANTLLYLGIVRHLTGDYRGAAEVLEEARCIYRDIGNRVGETNTVRHLGIVRQQTGDYPGAAELFQEALVAQRDLGNRLGLANTFGEFGIVRRRTGDYDAAARLLDEALAIYRDLGSRLGEANSLLDLGSVRHLTGDYDAATRLLDEALAIYRDLDSRLGEANAILNLGIVRRLTGHYAGAARAFDEALGIYRDLGDRHGKAIGLNELGTLRRVRGDIAGAENCHQEALELARAVGSSLDEANALAGQGRCAIALGHATAAEVLLRQALEIFQGIGAAEAKELRAELDALHAIG